ncbi:nucleotidyltransferase domain-containing protein [Occultella aeris]|uniref:Streptomycin 3''-adenylyltransferase n=1 Tax=Occultella aeris TaxID=2761496 RepID=A0A7M4DDV5_9MICO|nr:nucleotidyltransferase domain-containing protein [Occultella aeris]VZO35069.1 Streptomycin 3''-adenylyltransferase [Occultella aeris]
MSVPISEPWRAQADAISDLLTAQLTSVVGVYLHGSAALGGFGPTSDLDVLVVVRDEPEADWDSVGGALLRAAEGGRALELSVVRSSEAAAPAPPWPFVLHVNSGAHRYVLGGDGGDPDLIAHYAVVRAAGLPLYGPDPSAVVGGIERDVLIGYLTGELEWGRDEADQRYAMLNACRAVAYADHGALLSKIDGGRWWLERFGPAPLVTSALEAQAAGADLGPCSASARAFVGAAIARLDSRRS